MNVLILADRYHEALLILNSRTCASMLPVAGRPLVEYTLDLLVGTGVTHATVAVADHSEQIEAALGEGAAWGLELRYVQTSGHDPVTDLLPKLFPDSDEAVLVLEADRLRTQLDGLKLFLEKVAEEPEASHIEARSTRDLGFGWYRSPAKDHLEAETSFVEMPEIRCYPVDSIHRFHELNLAIANNEILGLELHVREVEPGIYQGMHSSVPRSGLRDSGILAASHCHIDPRAKVGPRVSMADDVLIDRDAKLEDCVILDGTYVGAGVELKRAVVWGQTVIQLNEDEERRSSQVIRVDDPSQLVDLRKGPMTGFFSRVFKAAASVLTWPLIRWETPMPNS